jgi:hypothetical protein
MKVLVPATWNWFYWRINPAIKTVIRSDKDGRDCKRRGKHRKDAVRK